MALVASYSIDNFVNPLPAVMPTTTSDDCRETMIPLKTGKQSAQSVRDSEWLRKYPNVRFKKSNGPQLKTMLKRARKTQLSNYLASSKFYNNVDDGEEKQKAIINKVSKRNPQFILSKALEEEAAERVNNPNSLSKPITTDNGMGLFEYNSGTKDNVGVVQRANAEFAARRDRYFIAPQAGETTVRGNTVGEDNLQDATSSVEWGNILKQKRNTTTRKKR